MNAINRRHLWIGLLAAVLSMASDLVLGWALYPTGDMITGMLGSTMHMSEIQLALGALMGGVGIPLQAFGFLAIAEYARRERRLIRLGAAATALLGGSVHVLCAVMLLIIRIACGQGFDPASAALQDYLALPGMTFALSAVGGLSLACIVPYMLGAAALLIGSLKGRLPRPGWVFSPLTAMLMLEIVTACLPNTEFANGLRMAGLGFGGVWTFAGWLWLTRN